MNTFFWRTLLLRLRGKLSDMSGPQAATLPPNIDMLNRGKYEEASAFKASQPMHPRYWSWFHQRLEGTRTPPYPLRTWSYCISRWYTRCREHGKQGMYSHRGPGSNSITTRRLLDSQHGILNGIVAVNESCIFHGPHWIVLGRLL